MNAIFCAVSVLSAIIFCIYSPTDFLPTLLLGGEAAAKCALNLFFIYAIWMGLSAVAEECRLSEGIAKLLSPAVRKIFKTKDKKAIENLAMNLSCNLLGIGGAATPYGVKAIEHLEREKNTFAQNLLFIINATSIQLIPTTVIALRAAQGSAAAHDIALPSLIATAFSTLFATGAYMLICKFKTR